MEYKYRIYEEVYNDIFSGKKTIEFRLLNEKSESIKIGDIIKFIVVNNNEKYVLVEVTDKLIYDNVDDLWNHKEVLTKALSYTKNNLWIHLIKYLGKKTLKILRL